MSKENIYPPKLAGYLLDIFVKIEHKFFVVGDLEESFIRYYVQKGKLSASLWYWKQVLELVPKFIIHSVKSEIRMLKSYIKVAVRHLYKNKSHSLINVAGLSASLSIFLFIVLFVQFELSFDSFHEKSERIFRVNQDMQMPSAVLKHNTVPVKVGSLMKMDFPEIVNTARLYSKNDTEVRYQGELFLEDKFVFADSTIFEMFDFPLVKGGARAVFEGNNALVITRETATRYFGNADPIGKIITLSDRSIGADHDFVVKGVIENVPVNSTLRFDFLASMRGLDQLFRFDISANSAQREPAWVWRWNGYTIYVELGENAEHVSLNEKLPEFVKTHFPPGMKDIISLSLIPLTDIRLKSDRRESAGSGIDITIIYVLLLLGALIVTMACVNFMNLATAKSAGRAKEVGVRKAMGAIKSELVRQYLLEAFVLSAISIGVAVFVVKLTLPLFNTLVEREITLNLFSNHIIGIILVATTFFVGIFSGAYPAFYLSAFSPVRVFKGNANRGSGKTNLRRSLILFQFTISIFLISSTLLIYNQIDFLLNKELGFNKENIIHVELPLDPTIRNKTNVLKKELLSMASIQGIAPVNSVLGISVADAFVRPEGVGGDGDGIALDYLSTDVSFLDVFPLEFIEGVISREHEGRSISYIVNQSVVNAFGWDEPVGKKIEWVSSGRVINTGTVSAVVRDFHFQSLHEKILPLAIAVNSQYQGVALAVKISAENTAATLQFMENKWKEVFDGRPFSYYFLDDRIESQYKAEQKLMQILVYLTFFAIFIGSLGLLGMISFIVEQRKKEIGIRKVLGATVSSVSNLLSREFLILVLISNVVAIPITYFAITAWAQSFAYKAGIEVGVFLLTSFLSLVMTVATLCYKIMQAARKNPVTALRYE